MIISTRLSSVIYRPQSPSLPLTHCFSTNTRANTGLDSTRLVWPSHRIASAHRPPDKSPSLLVLRLLAPLPASLSPYPCRCPLLHSTRTHLTPWTPRPRTSSPEDMNGANEIKKAAINKAKQVVANAQAAATANGSGNNNNNSGNNNGNSNSNNGNKKRRKGQDLKPIITSDPDAPTSTDQDTPSTAGGLQS